MNYPSHPDTVALTGSKSNPVIPTPRLNYVCTCEKAKGGMCAMSLANYYLNADINKICECLFV